MYEILFVIYKEQILFNLKNIQNKYYVINLLLKLSKSSSLQAVNQAKL